MAETGALQPAVTTRRTAGECPIPDLRHPRAQIDWVSGKRTFAFAALRSPDGKRLALARDSAAIVLLIAAQKRV